jgi:glycerol-3-phosphate dehydrogenase
VIGAGSFGTAVAVLLARGGLRTTLQSRTKEQAERLADDRENRVCDGASAGPPARPRQAGFLAAHA